MMDDQEPIHSIELAGERTVIHLAGELDSITAPALRAGLDSLIRGGSTDLVVDLAAVTFADSTGLGVLISALKKARQCQGRLELAAPAPVVVTLLRISGLNQVFTVHAGVDDALAR